jgi:hypothetical protein
MRTLPTNAENRLSDSYQTHRDLDAPRSRRCAEARPLAFVLLGAIAVAYFTARGSRSFFPLLNGSELAALYCFVFLFIAAIGGGTWGVDKLRAKEK